MLNINCIFPELESSVKYPCMTEYYTTPTVKYYIILYGTLAKFNYCFSVEVNLCWQLITMYEILLMYCGCIEHSWAHCRVCSFNLYGITWSVSGLEYYMSRSHGKECMATCDITIIKTLPTNDHRYINSITINIPYPTHCCNIDCNAMTHAVTQTLYSLITWHSLHHAIFPLHYKRSLMPIMHSVMQG